MYYVYILSCSNNKTYIGCTNNLKNRLLHHQSGQIIATKEKLPVKLIAYFAFIDKFIAFNFEAYLKSGSGRAFIKKHKLVYNDSHGEVA